MVVSFRDVWKIYLEQGQYERAKQYTEVRPGRTCVHIHVHICNTCGSLWQHNRQFIPCRYPFSNTRPHTGHQS